MIDWATIKSEMAQAVAICAQIDPTQVRWRDEAMGSTWAKGVSVWLRASMVRRHGIEEQNLGYVSPTSNQTVTMRGMRKFTMSVRAESFEQDMGQATFAGNIIDAIAMRIMRSSTKALITSFAIEDRLPTTFFSYKSDGRQVSCYVMDMMCLTADYDLDTNPAAGGWINEAIITGTVDSTAVSLDVKGS